jgi:hypothetical protein
MSDNRTWDQKRASWAGFVQDHGFQPVAGHPDDDECTYCPDGSWITYCGRIESDHEWSER